MSSSDLVARSQHPSNPAGEMSADELAAIAESLAESGVVRLVEAGTQRRWTTLIRTARFEAIVIAWPSGSGLGMHDHSGSAAAVHVVDGRLRERYLDASGVSRVRWLTAAETVRLPGDHVHEVINLSDTEVFSVHVYSPPLGDTSFRDDSEIIGASGDIAAAAGASSVQDRR